MSDRRVRVLVADDSEAARFALCSLLREEPRIEIVGAVTDGVEAVDGAIALAPDVITMDIRMPRLDGLGAIAAIMALAPTRILVVCDTSQTSQMDLSFRAIAAGALELIPKPGPGDAPALRDWGHMLAESVLIMSTVPVVRRRRSSAVPPALDVGPHMGSAAAVGIVASTGGPPALAELLGALPKELSAPVIVAQHMALGFARGLARWLSDVIALKVQFGDTGVEAEPGVVYLPPDGYDIELRTDGRLRISKGAAQHCPSGDHLLASVARSVGRSAIGVVLSGMGEDGARGALEIRRAGGLALAQEHSSCSVFGMPRAAAAVGAELMTLEGIALMIRRVCGGPEKRTSR